MRKLIDIVKRDAKRDPRMLMQRNALWGAAIFAPVTALSIAQSDWASAAIHACLMLFFIVIRVLATTEARWKRWMAWIYEPRGGRSGQ